MTGISGTASAPPRLGRVTLRAGTPSYVVVDGRLVGPRVLDRAVEVRVGDLGQREGEFNSYESDDGTTIQVRIEDEVR